MKLGARVQSVVAFAIIATLSPMPGLQAKPGDPKPKSNPTLGKEQIPSRILVFGTGTPVGIVSVRRKGAGSQEPWQRLQNGKATGKVRVPLGYDVRLDVDPKFSGDLALLDSLSAGDLQMINMADSLITDAGLARIAKFNDMKILNLRKNPITDAGLVHLAGMTALETLYLDDTQITDAGLDHLKGMHTLFHLNLGESGKPAEGKPRRITDAGIAKLAGLSTVVYLDLSGSGLTDAGVKHLLGLQGLYLLNLSGTMITEAALAGINQLRGVSDLNISNTGPVTATGAPAIFGIASLSQLTVHQGQIPPELLTELNAKRPGIKIKAIAP